jgi:hypothetical protein
MYRWQIDKSILYVGFCLMKIACRNGKHDVGELGLAKTWVLGVMGFRVFGKTQNYFQAGKWVFIFRQHAGYC